MAKMGLSGVAQLAEVVAAVGVVVSLIYVGRELQSNTAAVRGASIQEATRAQAELLLTRAVDPALNELYRRGDEDPSSLNESERSRYVLVKRQTWINLQNNYFQYDLDLLDQRVWDVYHRTLCNIWGARGSKETWAGHRAVLDSGFVEVVESCGGQ